MELTLTPYLNFNGDAAEAMRLYQSILGGELTMQTFGEAHMAESPAEKDLVVHATLKAGRAVLMASDTHPKDRRTAGDNVHMSLMGEDQAGLTQVFGRLAEGGRVDMPLAKQFWGDTFGMLTDKFGVHWMVNISAPSGEGLNRGSLER